MGKEPAEALTPGGPMNNQPPGLEELIKAKAKRQEALEDVFRPLAQLIARQESRILRLELEVSLLRILMENPHD